MAGEKNNKKRKTRLIAKQGAFSCWVPAWNDSELGHVRQQTTEWAMDRAMLFYILSCLKFPLKESRKRKGSGLCNLHNFMQFGVSSENSESRAKQAKQGGFSGASKHASPVCSSAAPCPSALDHIALPEEDNNFSS